VGSRLDWKAARERGRALTDSLSCLSLQFFSLSPSEIGLVLELLDAKVSELSISHSTNMNANDDPKKKELHVSRVADQDGNPMVLLKVAGEAPAVASLNTGEARVFRVRWLRCDLSHHLGVNADTTDADELLYW
jgi:hypothetical protein